MQDIFCESLDEPIVSEDAIVLGVDPLKELSTVNPIVEEDASIVHTTTSIVDGACTVLSLPSAMTMDSMRSRRETVLEENPADPKGKEKETTLEQPRRTILTATTSTAPHVEKIPIATNQAQNGEDSESQSSTSETRRQPRWYAKTFLLTFPRNNTPKQHVHDGLLNAWRDSLEWFVIAHEKHEDGTTHIHIALQFKRRVNVRSANYFDFLSLNGLPGGANHCNILKVKSPIGTVEYVTKADNDPVTFGNVPRRKGNSGSCRDYSSGSDKPKPPKVTKTIYDFFKSGKKLEDIHQDETVGPFVMCNLPKLRDYEAWLHVLDAKRKGPPAGISFATQCRSDSCKQVCEWLIANMMTPRRLKQKQLYIYGPPDSGKTTLLEKLRTHFRVFEMPVDDRRFNDWDDDAYDLAVMDEFKGQLPITFMNKFLDGQTMKLPILHGTGIMKRKNIPMIVCSNYTLQQSYHNTPKEGLDPLLIRFQVVEIEEQHKLDIDVILPENPDEQIANEDHGEDASIHLDNEPEVVPEQRTSNP